MSTLYLRTSAGYHQSGLVQAAKPIALGLNGQKHLELSVHDNVQALIFAAQEMKHYGSLLRWSWTSRGLITREEMQALHPNLSADDLTSQSTAFRELVPDIPTLVPILHQIQTVCFGRKAREQLYNQILWLYLYKYIFIFIKILHTISLACIFYMHLLFDQ